MKHYILDNKVKSIITIGILLLTTILSITGYMDDFLLGIGALLLMILTIIIPILLTLLGIVLYCLPSIIAKIRNHNNLSAVILVNLLLGWSILGWIISLIWSFTDNTNK